MADMLWADYVAGGDKLRFGCLYACDCPHKPFPSCLAGLRCGMGSSSYLDALALALSGEGKE